MEKCLPESEGGVGFRDMSNFNAALLAKQLWRMITNPELLIAKVLRARYCKGEDMMAIRAKKQCSYTWRSIIGSKDVVEKGLWWRVGDGSTVKVYEDKWVWGLVTGRIQGKGGERDGTMKVKELLSADGKWNEKKLIDLFLPHEIEGIKNTPVGECGKEDRRWWKYDSHGRFTVKSAYRCQAEDEELKEGTSSPDKKWWEKHVWGLDIQPKTKVYLWQAISDYIPTTANLKEHRVPTDGVCPSCKNRWATTEHTLLYCPLVRAIWRQSEFWSLLKLGSGVRLRDISGAIMNELGKRNYEVWCTMLWQVWTCTCNKKSGAENQMISSESRSVMILEIYKSVRKKVSHTPPLHKLCGDRKLKKPMRGCHRMDVDVLFDEERHVYGIGIIIRDRRGDVVAARARRTPPRTNVMVAEMMATIEGLTFSLECKIPVIAVYTHSLLTARIMANEEEAEELLPEDVMEIVEIARENMLVGVCHMFREANQAAHSLAQYVRDSNTDSTWVEDFPPW